MGDMCAKIRKIIITEKFLTAIYFSQTLYVVHIVLF